MKWKVKFIIIISSYTSSGHLNKCFKSFCHYFVIVPLFEILLDSQSHAWFDTMNKKIFGKCLISTALLQIVVYYYYDISDQMEFTQWAYMSLHKVHTGTYVALPRHENCQGFCPNIHSLFFIFSPFGAVYAMFRFFLHEESFSCLITYLHPCSSICTIISVVQWCLTCDHFLTSLPSVRCEIYQREILPIWFRKKSHRAMQFA